MANRFRDFTAPVDSKHNHLAEILEQDGITALLYRRTTGDGFTAELGSLSFVKKILIIISENSSSIGGNFENKTPKSLYNAVANEKDLRLNDVLRVDSVDYLVTDIDKIPIGATHITLETLDSYES